jgi:glycerophosphoryl diester phosphodiesterase
LSAWAELVRERRPLVLGHRGARVATPENTLEAIAAAADAGADGVEIDVRPCRTGELVVIHDATLARVTAGADGRAVASLSLAELASVKLAGAARVPRLEDVLALCRERDLGLDVELKRDVPSRRRAVVSAARALRSAALPLVVSSFDPPMLALLQILAPRLPVALLVEPGHAWLTSSATMLRCHGLYPEQRLCHDETVREWREAGLEVVSWTVNERASAERLIRAGVDGLIGDDPALLLGVRHSLQSTGISCTPPGVG